MSSSPSSSLAVLKRQSARLGWVLLLVGFVFGCLTLAVHDFSDEGDNLVTGLLLVRGYSLYGDLFSNHFPFAYYWAAGMVALFGKSILAVRLSVWLFQIAALAVAMKLSRYVLPLGLVGLMWGIMRHIYSGNMLLYHAFSGISLLVIFSIVLAVLLRRVQADWRHSLAIGLFACVAILADPLTVYAAGVAFIALFLADRKRGLMSGLFAAAGMGLFVAGLLISGTLGGFVEQAIVFNAEIFVKYKDANPVRFDTMLRQAIKGLEIADPIWWNLDPFRPIPFNGSDRWLFTGIFYRLAILLATLLLLVQKRFWPAIFLYLYACAALLNNTKGFRATPAILLAFFAAAALVTGAWWSREKRWFAGLHLACGVVIGLMAAWLAIRVVSLTYFEGKVNLSYDSAFAQQEVKGAFFRDIACNRPDVHLAHYPGVGYALWFADMKPVSRFIYMYPWEAEVFQGEVIDALDRDQASAVVYIRSREVWGLEAEDFLRPLFEYLDGHYVKQGDGLYLSPYLAEQCGRQAIGSQN